MFNVGTRLIVYKSNKKKGTGPTKGSTGYMVQCTQPQTSNSKGGYFFTQVEPKVSFVGAIIKVIFTKYDSILGKADRVETKNVLNLVPLVTKENKDIIANNFDSLFDKAVVNYKKEAMLEGLVICTILPVRCINLLDLFISDTKEYHGWINSLTKNNTFIEHISSLLIQSDKYKSNVSGYKHELRCLCNIAEYSNERESYINNITGDNIRRMYRAIKEVEPLIYINRIKPSIINPLSFLMTDGSFERDKANCLVTYMFIDYIMRELYICNGKYPLINSVDSTRQLINSIL